VYPLLQGRTPANVLAGSLQWPIVTSDLSVHFDADEVIRWRGQAYVAELRWDGPQDPQWERVWALGILGPQLLHT
jgi:hypothetical protein